MHINNSNKSRVCVCTLLMWDIELYDKVIIVQQLGIDKKSFDFTLKLNGVN